MRRQEMIGYTIYKLAFTQSILFARRLSNKKGTFSSSRS